MTKETPQKVNLGLGSKKITLFCEKKKELFWFFFFFLFLVHFLVSYQQSVGYNNLPKRNLQQFTKTKLTIIYHGSIIHHKCIFLTKSKDGKEWIYMFVLFLFINYLRNYHMISVKGMSALSRSFLISRDR